MYLSIEKLQCLIMEVLFIGYHTYIRTLLVYICSRHGDIRQLLTLARFAAISIKATTPILHILSCGGVHLCVKTGVPPEGVDQSLSPSQENQCNIPSHLIVELGYFLHTILSGLRGLLYVLIRCHLESLSGKTMRISALSRK